MESICISQIFNLTLNNFYINVQKNNININLLTNPGIYARKQANKTVWDKALLFCCFRIRPINGTAKNKIPNLTEQSLFFNLIP